MADQPDVPRLLDVERVKHKGAIARVTTVDAFLAVSRLFDTEWLMAVRETEAGSVVQLLAYAGKRGDRHV